MPLAKIKNNRLRDSTEAVILVIPLGVTPDNGFHFVGWSDDMANTNPVRRFVMTENFDWDIYPVCESDETYTLEVYADPEEGGSL